MLLLLILVVGLGSAGGDHFSQEEQQVLEELEHAGLLDVNLEDMLALEDSVTTEYDDYEDEMKMLEELRQAGVEELREAGLTEEEIESLLETDDYEEGEYEEYEVSEELDEAEIFIGDENRLTINQTYTLEFQCNYKLQRYPFDTQVNRNLD